MKTIILIVIAALFSGCVSGPPQHIVNDSGEHVVKASDIVQIRIDPATATRIDGRAITGEIFAEVFKGNEADPLFEITNTDLQMVDGPGGGTVRFTYNISGLIHFNGTTLPVRSTGSKEALFGMREAQHIAIEMAVVDAAQQSKLIIAAFAEAAKTR